MLPHEVHATRQDSNARLECHVCRQVDVVKPGEFEKLHRFLERHRRCASPG